MLGFSTKGDSLVWPPIPLSTGFWQVMRFPCLQLLCILVVFFFCESVQKRTDWDKTNSSFGDAFYVSETKEMPVRVMW